MVDSIIVNEESFWGVRVNRSSKNLGGRVGRSAVFAFSYSLSQQLLPPRIPTPELPPGGELRHAHVELGDLARAANRGF